MSRAVWADEGNDAADAVLRKNGITQVFFSVRDTKYATLDHLNEIKQRGFDPGLYLCAQGDGWPGPPQMSGSEWADWAYQKVQKEIAPGTSAGFPLVDLNCEVDSPGWIKDMITRWRTHSPRRVTAWSMACHKYPLFQGISDTIAKSGFYLKPQAYTGLNERVESSAEVLGWAALGIPAVRIQPFLLADQLGLWWSGTAFTQGGLPH